MNTNRLGNLGEARTLWEFVKREVPVYTQFGDTEKVDIIADFNGKLNKVQCKTTDSLKNGKVTWTLSSTTNTSSGYKRHTYTKDEIDYFALYSNQLDILLLIPIDVLLGKAEITIPIPYQKSTNQYSFLNYEDYLFDKIILEKTTCGE